MNMLSIIKNHKIITSVSAVVLVAAISVPVVALNMPKAESVASVEKVKVEAKESPTVTPEAIETPEPQASVAAASPSPTPSATPSSTPKSSNPYGDKGNLWYAYDRREKAGKIVGAWGTANSWPTFAREQGLVVDRIPQPGDIAIISSTPYIVESVSGSTFTASTSYGDGVVTKSFSLDDHPAPIDYRFIH